MEHAAQELGIDCAAELEKFGIDPRKVSTGEGFIPLKSCIDFLEYAASTTEHPDFGLRVANYRPALGFGVLGHLMKAAPDLGTGLTAAHSYLRVLTSDTHWELVPEGKFTVLVRINRDFTEQAGRQLIALSIAQYEKLMRAFLGQSWHPESVSFMFSLTHGQEAYRRHFKAPVGFEQAFNGMVFRSQDLSTPLVTSNASLFNAIKTHLDGLKTQVEDTVLDRSKYLIRQRMDSGSCSLETVAAELNLHPKSLQRALLAEGANFKQLLLEARLELARYYLSNSRIELNQLSEILGYSEPSVLSRAFRKAHGVSPQQWRQSESRLRSPSH